MTESENRSKFFDWLIENGLVEVKDIVKSVVKDEYPLLILLIKDRGTASVDTVIKGKDSFQAHKLLSI